MFNGAHTSTDGLGNRFIGGSTIQAVDYSAPPPYSPQSPDSAGMISGALMEQDKAIAALGMEFNEMENRLGPMVRPCPPEGTGGQTNAAPTPSRSELAAVLEKNNHMLRVLASRIRMLNARIDL